MMKKFKNVLCIFIKKMQMIKLYKQILIIFNLNKNFKHYKIQKINF